MPASEGDEVIAGRLTRIVKGIANPLLDSSGVYDAWLARLDRHASWTILMYHRVIADKSEDPFDMGMCVTGERFAEQLAYLARAAEVVPLGDTIARLAAGREPARRRMVSITLDDGYRDNLTRALPLLQAEGLPCTVFVTTGGLETGEPFWWDRVIVAVARTTCPELVFERSGANPLRLPLAGQHRWRSVRRLVDVLWEHPDEGRDERIAGIERDLGVDARAFAPARLTPGEVVTLAEAGCEIAAHSVSHRNLARLSASEIAAEMTQSKAHLERLVGRPVTGFAYPAGHVSATVTAAAREAGFAYAVGTRSAVNLLGDLRLHELDRIGMPDTAPADFKRSWGSLARRLGAPAVGAP